MTISETELIIGCKANHRDLQKVLYERYSGKLFLICLRYMSSREEAEDVLQDGFVKVFSSMSQYTHAGSFEGWMRRIIVNTALESIRKKKIDFAPDDILTIKTHHVIEPDVFHTIAIKDLLKLIQELPNGCRLIFNLYVIEGYTHREIAEKLNISEGTSKSQLARARQLLQDRIKPANKAHKIIQ